MYVCIYIYYIYTRVHKCTLFFCVFVAVGLHNLSHGSSPQARHAGSKLGRGSQWVRDLPGAGVLHCEDLSPVMVPGVDIPGISWDLMSCLVMFCAWNSININICAGTAGLQWVKIGILAGGGQTWLGEPAWIAIRVASNELSLMSPGMQAYLPLGMCAAAGNP